MLPPTPQRKVNGRKQSARSSLNGLQHTPASSKSSRSNNYLQDPNISTLSMSPSQSRSTRSNLSIVSFASPSGVDSGKTARPTASSLFPDRINTSRMTLDDSMIAEDSDNEEIEEDLLVERMRLSRNDAMQQHLYSTAAFWGQKVYEMTADPTDAFWLAQIHFLTHQFAKAERILTSLRPEHKATLPPTSMRTKDKGKQKETFDESLAQERAYADDMLNIHFQANPATASNLIRLTDISVACRYLAAQCMVRLGKWTEALDLLGLSNPFRTAERVLPTANGFSSPRKPAKQDDAADVEASSDGGIKFEASMCHLRGLVHLHLNAADKAKECFLEALSLDVKCFESFESLVDGNMMTVEEEWSFVQGLRYRQQLSSDDAEFVRMAYTIRLKKYKHLDEFAACRERLSKEYGLANDPDVLFGLADELFAGFRWADCYAVTSFILATHEAHAPTLPLHLASMYHLPALHSKLFLLAHEHVSRSPDSALSWYAVGLWYFANRRWDEARRFFGKAVLLDARFSPAWIAFGHAYAYEGEHDQAITAYSTAQRHFQGTHLPFLFIGMQHLHLSNVKLAQEYLKTAWDMCQIDPLLANEMGVCAYWSGDYEAATRLFTQTLNLSKSVQGSDAAWLATHINLGHAWRKLRNLEKAKESFEHAISIDSDAAQPHLGLGYVLLGMGLQEEAVEQFHEALGRSPVDPVGTEMLRVALLDHMEQAVWLAQQKDDMHVGFPGLSKQIAKSLDAEVILFENQMTDEAPALHLRRAGQETSVAEVSKSDAMEESMDVSG